MGQDFSVQEVKEELKGLNLHFQFSFSQSERGNFFCCLLSEGEGVPINLKDGQFYKKVGKEEKVFEFDWRKDNKLKQVVIQIIKKENKFNFKREKGSSGMKAVFPRVKEAFKLEGETNNPLKDFLQTSSHTSHTSHTSRSSHTSHSSHSSHTTNYPPLSPFYPPLPPLPLSSNPLLSPPHFSISSVLLSLFHFHFFTYSSLSFVCRSFWRGSLNC